jgi:hypothetical protein
MFNIGLDELAEAYQRVQKAIARPLTDGIILESDPDVVDNGFFLLIFGQIERRITDLAVSKAQRQEEKTYWGGRSAPFDRKLEFALRDHGTALKDEIGNWYDDRSDIAHGRSLASGIEIGPVLARAREIDALLDRIGS